LFALTAICSSYTHFASQLKCNIVYNCIHLTNPMVSFFFFLHVIFRIAELPKRFETVSTSSRHTNIIYHMNVRRAKRRCYTIVVRSTILDFLHFCTRRTRSSNEHRSTVGTPRGIENDIIIDKVSSCGRPDRFPFIAARQTEVWTRSDRKMLKPIKRNRFYRERKRCTAEMMFSMIDPLQLLL
jgi:hypothetical protein